MLQSTVLLFALTLAGSLMNLDNSAELGDQTAVDLGRSFRLRHGNEAEVSGAPMRVRFERVSEDSRCPVGATCVWAGDAVVQLATIVKQLTSRVELHTNPDLKQDQAVRDGFRIRLLGLEPHPNGTAPVAASDYVVTLIIERSS